MSKSGEKKEKRREREKTECEEERRTSTYKVIKKLKIKIESVLKIEKQK